MKFLAGEEDLEIDLLNAEVTGDGMADGIDVLRLVDYLAGKKVTLE